MRAMKVLNLRCANGHGFEGWFASDDDFIAQHGRGLVECPLCADTASSAAAERAAAQPVSRHAAPAEPARSDARHRG